MIRPTILVKAEWDSEAGVFVATSEDVPGLVAEAATPDALRESLEKYGTDVVWTDEIDMAADTLWRLAREQSGEALIARAARVSP